MRTIPAIALTTILFATTIDSSIAATQKCETYQHRINRLQSLNTKGGKARQQESRRQQISNYEDELHKCSNIQKIQIVTGRTKQRLKTGRQKLRRSNTQNPQLQQLIKTCNYWIEQNNQTPSWDNANHKDTACRAVDENEKPIDPPTTQVTTNTRKLKDCIKPNNLIDNDVNECMKGSREPSWKKQHYLSLPMSQINE